MKFNLVYMIFLVLYTNCICAQDCPTPGVIPQPQKITLGYGHFEINSSTAIFADNNLDFYAKQLKEYLEPPTGFDFKIAQRRRSDNTIELKLDKSLSYLGEEGYKMRVNSDKITIEAFNSKGIFWAIQTLRQLLPADILRHATTGEVYWSVPCLQIEDQPRFKWRGLLIDYSRTFWNKQVTEKYIDAMAYYKMNILHMHLTDDQGWRIEIDKYPELAEKASKFDTIYHEPGEREGFYTKGDIREIVEYARQRNIEIIPEIEMPGHTSEVFSVYPELSCNGRTAKIHPFFYRTKGNHQNFCVGNDKSIEFLENVLSEIIGLFPSQYIHIGGDEAPKDPWKNCSLCQQRIKENGLKDEHELQSWFVKRIESYLNSHGKKLVGWDEISQGGLSKTATLMYWRSRKYGIPMEAVTQGNQIVMTPQSHCYFDYTYKKLPTAKVYSFKPVPEDLREKYPINIIGVQANFWSQSARTVPTMDRQIFPRILALSEVAWTQEANKNWDSFYSRLNSQYKALDRMGIYYYKGE